MALTWRERYVFEQIVAQLRAEDPPLARGARFTERVRSAKVGSVVLAVAGAAAAITRARAVGVAVVGGLLLVGGGVGYLLWRQHRSEQPEGDRVGMGSSP